MKSSWRIGSVAGIGIELHISFLIFILLFAFLDMSFIPILLILFTSIALHEITHSLVAQRYGITVTKILLLPIGGMAAMKDTKMTPQTEFKMAIAGPMFNFAVCLLVVALVWLTSSEHLLYNWSAWNLALEGTFAIPFASLVVSSVFWLNWLLGAFNLFVPAIPLDGGRVFRSLIAMFTKNYVAATRIAATVSTVVTFFIFIYALLTFNIILLLIAVFIYFGANAELEFALTSKLLSSVPLKALVRQNFLVVPGSEPLDKVLLDMIASKSSVVFIESSKGLRVASLYDVRNVPKSQWKNTAVRKIAKSVRAVQLKHNAVYALKRMNEHGVSALPVTDAGKVVGAVFKDDFETVFQILKVAQEG